MSYACMCTPMHTIPIKAVPAKGPGRFPLEGIAAPFPAGATDCVQDDLFPTRGGWQSSVEQGIPRSRIFKFLNNIFHFASWPTKPEILITWLFA